MGAQVMLTRNVSTARGLVNGARGVVQRFCGSSIRLPVVLFANVRWFLTSHLHFKSFAEALLQALNSDITGSLRLSGLVTCRSIPSAVSKWR